VEFPQPWDPAFSSNLFHFPSPRCFKTPAQKPDENVALLLAIWLANLRELVDAVEVGEGLGDTLGHGLLALTDPDTGVVEPG
jgi:hypothetical protein